MTPLSCPSAPSRAALIQKLRVKHFFCHLPADEYGHFLVCAAASLTIPGPGETRLSGVSVVVLGPYVRPAFIRHACPVRDQRVTPLSLGDGDGAVIKKRRK